MTATDEELQHLLDEAKRNVGVSKGMTDRDNSP